jgi:hypothetical protein
MMLGAAALGAVPSANAEESTAAELTPSAEAAKTGEPVEVTGARTPTDTVYALPDGTFSREIAAAPVRVATEDGWEAVDLDLQRNADGSISPKAAPGGIEFSGGGDTNLSAISLGSTRTTTDWPHELPEPTLDGPTATYADVFPGVDLKMSVTDGGITQVLVVEDSEAASNPELAELALPTTVEGGKLTSSHGGLAVKDQFGREVGHSVAPLMWDSSGKVLADDNTPAGDTSEAAIGQRVEGPATGDEIAAVPLEVSDDSITLAPGDADLASPEVDYPLYIDPSTAPSKTAWSMVFKENSSMEFYKWTDSGGQGVGYQNYNGVSTKRLFWKFGTSAVAKAKISSAYFKTQVLYGASCDNTDVKIYRTGSISSSTNWGNQPSWSDYLSTRTVDPCPAGKEPEWSVTAGVQYAADHSSSSLTLGLRASSETNPRAWKRFSYKATLVINYSKYPYTPSSLKVNGKPCSATTVARLPRTTPTGAGIKLSAVISDPDGGTLEGDWHYNPGTSISGAVMKITRTGPLASGSTHVTEPLTIDPAMIEDGHIKSGDWVAIVQAEDMSSLHLSSGWDARCRFYVDADLPPEPIVTAPGTWAKGTDVSVTFTAGDPADTTAFNWVLNGSAPPDANKVTAVGTDKTATVSMKSPTVGRNVLRVWAYDAAGNRSDNPYEWEFEVQGLDASSRSLWTFDDEFGSVTAADRLRTNHLTVDPATWLVRGRYDAANAPVEDDVLSMLGTSSSATAIGQMLKTDDDSFLLSAWLDPALAPGSSEGERTAVSYGSDAKSTIKLGIAPADDYATTGEYVYQFSVWDSSGTGAYRTVRTEAPASMDSGLEHVIGWYEASTNTLHVADAGDETFDFLGAEDAGVELAETFIAPAASTTDKIRLGSSSDQGVEVEKWIGAIDQVSLAQGTGGGVVSRQLHSEKYGIIWNCEYGGCS